MRPAENVLYKYYMQNVALLFCRIKNIKVEIKLKSNIL